MPAALGTVERGHGGSRGRGGCRPENAGARREGPRALGARIRTRVRSIPRVTFMHKPRPLGQSMLRARVWPQLASSLMPVEALLRPSWPFMSGAAYAAWSGLNRAARNVRQFVCLAGGTELKLMI